MPDLESHSRNKETGSTSTLARANTNFNTLKLFRSARSAYSPIRVFREDARQVWQTASSAEKLRPIHKCTLLTGDREGSALVAKTHHSLAARSSRRILRAGGE
jgi:hypothetical protein